MKIRKRIFYLLIVFFSIITYSCNHNINQSTIPQKIPEWYLNPSKDNDIFWFDSGQGIDKEKAVISALNNIASKISVTVNSDFHNVTKEINGIPDSFSESKIELSVNKTTFPGFEIVRIGQINNTTYVIVKVNKQKFIEAKNNDFNLKNNQINLLFNQIKKQHELDILKHKDDLKKQIEEAEPIAKILSTFNVKSPLKICISDYTNFINILNSKIASLNFCIYNDPQTKIIADHIKELLTNENIHIVNRISNNKKSAVIKLKGNIHKLILDGEYLVKLTTDIIVKTGSNRVISNKKHNTSGSSVINYDMAIKNASMAFYNKAKKDGILKILGLQ